MPLLKLASSSYGYCTKWQLSLAASMPVDSFSVSVKRQASGRTLRLPSLHRAGKRHLRQLLDASSRIYHTDMPVNLYSPIEPGRIAGLSLHAVTTNFTKTASLVKLHLLSLL